VLHNLFSETAGLTGAVLRIMLNSRSTGLNRDLLGTTVTGSPFPIRQEDGWAYAAATDDRRPSFNATDGAAPPLFAVKVLAGPAGRLLLHPELGMNLLRMLHGEQAFTFIRPLRYGWTVIPAATITGFREVDSGEILDMGLEIRGPDGEELVTGASSFFLTTRQGGGSTSGEGKEKAAPEAAPFPQDMPGRFSRAVKIDPTQPRRYAAASGDRNPIHTNRVAARLAGLPRPIMHGLCMMAMAGREILEARDADPGDMKELSLRFSRAAFPGRSYVIRGADGADGGVDFVVTDDKDRPVLSRGRARLG